MNIVFDLGKVLLDWDPRSCYRKIFDDEAKMEWFLAHVCTSCLEPGTGPGAELCRGDCRSRPRGIPDHAEAIAAYDTRWHRNDPQAH